MPPRQSSERTAPKSALDSRFANLNTDPRYRLPSRKQTHVKIDQRFAHMLRDDEFSAKASIDRYGRRIPGGSGKEKLQRMYRLDDSDDDRGEQVDDDDHVKKELARVNRIYDPAREGGFSESSSSESEDEASSSSSEDDDDEQDAAVEAGLDHVGAEDVPTGQVSSRLAAVNLDWDNIRAVDLMAVANSFCPSDGRILNVSIYPSDFGKERMQREELEGPPRELFTSSKSNSKSKMEAAAAAADASDSTSTVVSEGDENDNDEDNDEKIQKSLLAHAAAPEPEINSTALRTYQLSRLRYYYAIITCSNASTAHALYNSMDSREYLSTANFFDLRFVPDDVDFDEKPKDVCDRVSEAYRPQEFVTDALTHSRVRLTWDEDDQGRKDAQKRAFGAGEWGKGKGRRADVDENDLKAYVGSDSDSPDDDGPQSTVVAVDGLVDASSTVRHSKSDQARRKMREALGLSADVGPNPKTTKPAAAPGGNMQITFSAGLTSNPAKASSNGASSIFQNNPSDAHEETTREKYIRKEKERKARRKAKLKSAAPDDDNNNQQPQSTLKNTNTAEQASVSKAADTTDDLEDPFDDPFFNDPAAANAAARKTAKKAKRAQEAAEASAAAEKRAHERAQLELLMDDDNGAQDGLAGSGFNMAAIQKAEKKAARKGRKGARQRKSEREAADAELERADDFEMDVADPRFASVFESHEFAIDPSSARFSGTKGMKRLLEEGRRKRRGVVEDEDVAVDDGRSALREQSKGGEPGGGSLGEVDELVRKIKRRKAG